MGSLIADWRNQSSETVAEITVVKRVTGVTGVVVTSKPGIIKVVAPFSMGGVAMQTGDLIYCLTDMGEGFFKGYSRGSTVEDIDGGWKELSLMSRPTAEWWAQVRTLAGNVGWTNKMESFRGVDGCSGGSVDPIPANAELPPEGVNGSRATPSFDCSRDRTPAEILICGDGRLASLDVEMVGSFNTLLAQLRETDRARVRREHLDGFREYSRRCNARAVADDSGRLYRCIEDHLASHTTALRSMLAK